MADYDPQWLAAGFRPLVSTANWPPVDVYQIPEGWLIKAEIAGIDPSQVQLHVENGQLHFKGQRPDTHIGPDWIHFSMEISYSDFERVIPIPDDLSQAEIESEYIDGMLYITIRPSIKVARGQENE